MEEFNKVVAGLTSSGKAGSWGDSMTAALLMSTFRRVKFYDLT